MTMAIDSWDSIISSITNTAVALRKWEQQLLDEEASLIVSGSHAVAIYEDLFERILKEIDV